MVEDEVVGVVVPDPVNPHVSESYSKLQLHKKWTEALAKANRLAQDLADVKKGGKVLEKKLKETEKSLKADSLDKSRAEKYKYDLTVVGIKSPP